MQPALAQSFKKNISQAKLFLLINPFPLPVGGVGLPLYGVMAGIRHAFCMGVPSRLMVTLT